MEDTLGVRQDERTTLGGFLDWYRSVVQRKIDGLSHEQATKVMTASGLSPLGVVQHLAWVERGRFREVFLGEDVESIGTDDNTAEFDVASGQSVEAVVAFYRDETAQARRIVSEAPSLDALSAQPTDFAGPVSLRWILIHMVEETARHAGHLDVMREEIDGQTGD